MKFELVVETHPDEGIARLYLLDPDGVQIAASHVDLNKGFAARWEAIFDIRGYVERYSGALRPSLNVFPKNRRAILDEIGVFLGQSVLGPEIMAQLTEVQHGTLLIRLPRTADDPLAAGLARVPWEIARAHIKDPSLLERNLVVRATTENNSLGLVPVRSSSTRDPLRVLLVFAEVPGSKPLAMRLERENLLNLFFDEILPRRRVEIDVLCHGVTRSDLKEQIQLHGGYEIIHWSGHGGHNFLELQGESDAIDGSTEHLSGPEFMQLIREAGTCVPALIFLSACLSGTFVSVKDWAEFRVAVGDAVTGGPEKEAGVRNVRKVLANSLGYTGTALELLRAGVPQVVAMRHEVSDDYARDLACHFYRYLFSDSAVCNVAGALGMARGEMARVRDSSLGYDPIDHATPLVFGDAEIAFAPAEGRSDQLGRRWPQPQPLLSNGSRELDLPENFVGRDAELTRLASRWLPKDQSAVAIIQGLAGLGKTAIAAEAIHLWQQRFDLVLAFQAKPLGLALEEFYSQVDSKLVQSSPLYVKKVTEQPNLAVHLPATAIATLDCTARFERMRMNLTEVLCSHDVLLVIDNFEANLESSCGPKGCLCQDPEWDRLLRQLAERLPTTGSRVLITSRHRLASLAESKRELWLPLGPLPMNEAALYIRSQKALGRLFFTDEIGKVLVMRLMQVSRGHPLILNRLSSLAENKSDLSQALDQLATKALHDLPDIFSATKSESERDRERSYLEDVTVNAIDLLINRASPNARRLLWIVTLANEPVPQSVIQGIWSGRSVWDEEFEKIRHITENLHLLSSEQRSHIENFTTLSGQSLMNRLEELKSVPPMPPVLPLLDDLRGVGLLACERSDVQLYVFHELVRERIIHWMTDHQIETAGKNQVLIWQGYADYYENLFWFVPHDGQPHGTERAIQAGHLALKYMVHAGSYDQIAILANAMLASTKNPILAWSIVEQLRIVLGRMPSGHARTSTRANLANALGYLGRGDEALQLLELSTNEAEAAEDWSEVAWICHSWATKLAHEGHLSQARAAFLRSSTAWQKAGGERYRILASEIEVLQLDIIGGRAASALPRIKEHLDELRSLRKRDTKNAVINQTIVNGLLVCSAANKSLERWRESLDTILEMEQILREIGASEWDLARTRFPMCSLLIKLNRLADAQRLAEWCLAVFQKSAAMEEQAFVLSDLADIWERRGDFGQALELRFQVLATRDRLSNPSHRAAAHDNLAKSLERAKRRLAAAQHQLAAGVYTLVSGHEQNLSSWQANLALLFRLAAQDGERFELPRLSDLLGRSEFVALHQFLIERGVNLVELESYLNRLVDATRLQVQSHGSRAPFRWKLPNILHRLFRRK